MAAYLEGITIYGNVLAGVSYEYLEKNNGYFEIPNSVTAIGGYTFAHRTDLKQVTIPDSLETIGEFAFARCHNLRQVVIPNSVSTIGSSAFSGCYSLEQVIIPDSVTSIGTLTFDCCTNLKQVTIPSSVTTIGNNAFFGCNSLNKITIPDSLTTISRGAFDDCHKDLEITITTFDLSKEKAQALKQKLQADYPNIKIHIDNPLERLKGIPPSSHNKSIQKAANPHQTTKTNQEFNHGSEPRRH